eukprot:749743-Pyramimonas_sp.AAC.1
MQRKNNSSAQAISDLSMQQPNAPDNSTTSFAKLARVSHRVQTSLSMRQADAPDVSKSIPVITSPVAPLQPEFSAEYRQHLSR